MEGIYCDMYVMDGCVGGRVACLSRATRTVFRYQRLIDNWGTSYVTWSNFGGGLNLDIFTNG